MKVSEVEVVRPPVIVPPPLPEELSQGSSGFELFCNGDLEDLFGDPGPSDDLEYEHGQEILAQTTRGNRKLET